MNNSVNATTELALTELLYVSPIRLFPTLDEININDIQLSDVGDYIDRIMKSVSIAKDNHITAKTIQTRNASRLNLQSVRYDYVRLQKHSPAHQEKWSFSQTLSSLLRSIQDHQSGTQNLELQVRIIAQGL